MGTFFCMFYSHTIENPITMWTDEPDEEIHYHFQAQNTDILCFVCSIATNAVGYKAPGSTSSSSPQDILFPPLLPLPRNAPSTYLLSSAMLSRTRTALCALFGLALVSHSVSAFNPLASTNVVNYWGQKYVVFTPSPSRSLLFSNFASLINVLTKSNRLFVQF